MKTTHWMMTIVLAAALTPAALAQRIALDPPDPALEARAKETVEITLDGELLRLGARFLLVADDADAERLAALVGRLQGIYVRSYSFEEEGAYDPAVVERFRSRVGSGWQRIVNVRSAGEDNVEIYTHVKGSDIAGLVIIAAEPRELTLVNIVGPIDLEQLSMLEGQFGIPMLRARSEGKR